jgi:hypothetical protein
MKNQTKKEKSRTTDEDESERGEAVRFVGRGLDSYHVGVTPTGG